MRDDIIRYMASNISNFCKSYVNTKLDDLTLIRVRTQFLSFMKTVERMYRFPLNTGITAKQLRERGTGVEGLKEAPDDYVMWVDSYDVSPRILYGRRLYLGLVPINPKFWPKWPDDSDTNLFDELQRCML